MMKKTSRGTVLLFLLLIATGCVTLGKYRAKEDEAGRYQTEVADLSDQLAAARDDIADLTARRDSLAAAKRDLEIQVSDLTAALEKSAANNRNLMKALEATTAEKDQLIADLTKNRQELEAVIGALEHDLTVLQDQIDNLQEQVAAVAREKEADLARQRADYESLLGDLNEEINRGEVTISSLQDRLSVTIVNRILFLSGEAIVRQKGQTVLDRVGAALSNLSNQRIVIEGHTDNVPIGPKLRHLYPTNWELSTARATTVARHLIDEAGIDPGRISVAGYADTKPVATNTTDEGRAQNRRIEILLLPMKGAIMDTEEMPADTTSDPSS